MKILFVASEMTPYAKTGGLADVIGSLPQSLSKKGHDIRVFIPKYEINTDKFPLKKELKNLKILVGNDLKKVDIYSLKDIEGVIIYFISCDEFFKRKGLYGTKQGDYKDNDARFILFAKAVLEAVKKINFCADIYHLHDWQSALVAVYLKTLYRQDSFFIKAKSIITIHNLAYQGLFEKESLIKAGLSLDFFTFDKLEYWGKFNFLKAGIVYADWITTVSPSYAYEIQTKEFGYGLEGVLKHRANNISGIINGLDYEYWNPKTDPNLIENYDVNSIKKKIKNKLALQKENGLKIHPNIFLIGMITRLVDQKGLNIVSEIIEELMKEKIQFVLLGTGENKYHRLFEELGKKYYTQIGVHLCFDEKMAKRIYAGADAFLMCSYYEPCGLGQLISLRYGTIPIVRKTGGLKDTIKDITQEEQGNGFSFKEYSSKSLLETIKRAYCIFNQDKKKWLKIIEVGMQQDFSWQNSAKEYEKLYKDVYLL